MIGVQVDIGGALDHLEHWSREQVPFAAALAINRTADEAMLAGKKVAAQHMVFRQQRFLDFMFRQVERASKTNLSATIGITGPKANLLTRHEEGGLFTAPDPMQPFFIPSKMLRPTPQSEIPRAMYPKALRLMERGDVVGKLPAKGKLAHNGHVMIQGKNSTYVVTSPDGRQLYVFQRIGPEQRESVLLWFYKPRINVPPALHWNDTVTQVVHDRFELNFAGMMDYAMRTAK